jgi:prostaglandin-H2 D-isomerase / glutathione transferase
MNLGMIKNHLNNFSKIKILYWDNGGIAEPIRMVLRYRGIKFEDVYVTNEEWINGVKDQMPWNNLPIVIFEENNQTEILCQSKSILKYFGKKLNLYDNLYINQYKIDQYIDTMEDTYKIFTPLYKMNNENKLKEIQKLCKKGGEFWELLNLWNKNIKNKFLVNSKMTIADIYVLALFKIIFEGLIDGVSKNILNNFPILKEYLEFVEFNYNQTLKRKKKNIFS